VLRNTVILLVGELSFDDSHALFRGAFTLGFPWEVLKVFSGPPNVVFTWRHWGHLEGSFQDNQGHGEKVEMFGLGRIGLNEDLKVQRMEIFYDPETFIKVMEGRLKPVEMEGGKALVGDVYYLFEILIKLILSFTHNAKGISLLVLIFLYFFKIE